MNSFGIWAKYKDNESKSPVEVHANLWHIGKNTDNAFIDFGVMIPQYTNLLNMTIILPFSVPAESLSDLSNILLQDGIGSLVFNTECSVQVKSEIGKLKTRTLCLDNSEKHILLLPITESSSYYGISITFDEMKDLRRINIDFSKYRGEFNDCEKIYIRFRIRHSIIKESMFCKLSKKNRYLESAFTGTQIIDFMVNELRNIKPEVNELMTNDGFELVNLSKVHFFVMEPAENDVTAGDAEGRRLEPGWKNYLNEGDYQDNTLVYHWSKRANKDIGYFSNYSKLVKVTSSETNLKLIITYILIVISLSVVANIFYDGLKLFFEWLPDFSISVLKFIADYLSKITS